jgi:hypothetical protein
LFFFSSIQGHTDNISEFSWWPIDDVTGVKDRSILEPLSWLTASVADDNILQIWKMAQIFSEENGNGDEADEDESVTLPPELE